MFQLRMALFSIDYMENTRWGKETGLVFRQFYEITGTTRSLKALTSIINKTFYMGKVRLLSLVWKAKLRGKKSV